MFSLSTLSSWPFKSSKLISTWVSKTQACTKKIIRLSRIIAKLDIFTNHTLIHTGQNYDYELNQIFFEDLEIRQPDYYLNSSDSNATKTIGKILISVDEILEEIKPDYVHVMSDGQIIKTGESELALELEKHGYEWTDNFAKEL